MNNLPQLTEDEVRYICSVIPLHDSVYYFKRYPKDFAKVMPGFRATSMKSQAQVSALLFRCRNQPFISTLIEKHISNWISEIQEHIAQSMEDGDSKELALLHTLPLSFFADNISLFFKLVDEEYTEEYIAFWGTAIKAIKELDVKQEKANEELKAKESEISKLQSKLNLAQTELERTGNKISERSAEIKALKRINADIEKLRIDVQNNETIILSLNAKVQEREDAIQGLLKQLSEARDIRQQLETQIRAELEKQQSAKATKQAMVPKPKRPYDMEEFKEYLGYNLESLGVSTDSECFFLLKEHLSNILFRGIPIVINRGVGMNLMKCVANALIGAPKVKMLTFNKNLSVQDIDSFLSTVGRVVCLDNFVGNFNETELFPLFDNHRDKIIFLTVSYDRTLQYISEEFLRYCQYINLNHLAVLLTNAELTEDPATAEEIECEPQWVPPDSRYSTLLREVLIECGFPKSLVEQKSAIVCDELSLCLALAFDILPYCEDVLQIAPYNSSGRLIKYAGDTGRCPYKNLLREWFAQ